MFYRGNSLAEYRKRKGMLSDRTMKMLVDIGEFLGSLAILSFAFVSIIILVAATSIHIYS